MVSAAEATAREIDLAVRDLIEEADTRARAILERRRGDLDAGVALLIARETLTAEEFAPLRPAAVGRTRRSDKSRPTVDVDQTGEPAMVVSRSAHFKERYAPVQMWEWSLWHFQLRKKTVPAG